MNFTKLALKRPVSVLIIVLALLVFGLSAIASSPVELMPDMEMPMLIISTVYPGAGPEEVQDLVTRVVEDAVSTLGGVKNVQSQSQENASMVMLELEYGTNMDLAHMKLQENLDLYKNSLPEDATDPVIIEISMDMMSTITLSARATGDVDLLYYVDEEIVPEFEKLDGVASVDVSGGQKDYIRIQLDEQRLNQYKLDMNAVVSTVSAADFSIPVGSADRGDQSLSLRGGVSYKSAESLKSIPITLRSGKVIRLSDVADVRIATEQQSSLSRYNGEQTVTVDVKKRQSASTLDVTSAVTRRMEQINSRNIGVELSVVNDSSEQILSSIQTVFSTLILGIVLSMLVLFLFFGDWKASLIVGSSMPISLLTTLILMNAMGFSINVVSLGGLVIGVGMMVDNSIVVIESCFRAREGQRTLHEAAVEGARIVTSSIIASTLTTIVVFLPISILQGMSGQMFKQLGFTIIFALTASLVSALTLVPLLFVRTAPAEKTESWTGRSMRRLENAYGNFLKKTFSHKKLVVLVAVALLIVSFGMAAFIPMQLMPDIDQGIINISVDTKPGLKLERVDEILSGVERMVLEHPDVERCSLTGGSGSASIAVYLKSKRTMQTKEVVDEWRAQCRDTVGYEVEISAYSMMDMLTGGSNVDVNLQSTDLDQLKEASAQVEELLNADEDIVRVTSTLTSGNPQAEIHVDPIRAAAIGLTPKQVVGMVYNTLSGSKAATLRQDGREYDIRVEFPEGRYENLSDLSGLMITSTSGTLVPLLDIATIEYSNSPQSISRKNNQYLVTISGQPTTAAQLTAPSRLMEQVAKMDFPEGVTITQSDANEAMMEEFSALFGAIGTAVLLVFMVMAMQFESTKFSLIVMICIPFSLIGSFLLLLTTGSTLSMPSLMGFLMLVGIVINNGILFIDTANQLGRSMDPETALVYAGRSRLRPILMTTLTTVLSMVPMGLGIGSGSEVMQGMAVVIIGGLCASTVLTLLLLPAFYLLFGGGKPKKERKKRGKKGGEEPEVPETPALPEMTPADLL